MVRNVVTAIKMAGSFLYKYFICKYFWLTMGKFIMVKGGEKP